MINAMSTWAKSIILAVIVSTIIQMILPEGKNKKYIKTITSILTAKKKMKFVISVLKPQTPKKLLNIFH